MAKVASVTLNNGVKMPIIGLGTWKSKPGEVEAAVEAAIDAGYRHIDCAHVYQNEKEVGAALSKKLKENSVKREELFITSKLWNTFHRPDLVKGALKTTLADLGLEYVDLYLIHWPFAYKEDGALFPADEAGKILYSDVDFVQTWKKMEECVGKGLVRSIGVSNFNSQQLDKLLTSCSIKPAVNQVECHPYLNQSKLSDFCKDRGIVLTAYSPLGSPDRPWAKPNDVQLMDDPKLKQIADSYNKSPAQILIKYQIQRNHVVIPKSVTKQRIQDNLNVFDFELSSKDIAQINSFDCNGRVCHLNWIDDHPLYPFNIDF